jgi:hypothetical protein
MKWPAPTRAAHDQFCRNEGWTVVRNATGKKNVHHINYELALSDGTILRTRISRPPDRSNYGASMWAHILRDQLAVDEAFFWVCVNDGVAPDRGGAKERAETIPLEVVQLLLNRVGMSETEVGKLSRAEAIARLNQFWQEGHS